MGRKACGRLVALGQASITTKVYHYDCKSNIFLDPKVLLIIFQHFFDHFFKKNSILFQQIFADPEAGFRLVMCTFMEREQKRLINGDSTLTSQFVM